MPADKTCRRCGDAKPADGFYRSKVNRDGLSSYCRACSKAYARTAPSDLALSDARRHGLRSGQARLFR